MHNRLLGSLGPRLFQNCTILLSRLKLTNRELRRIVLTMDRDDHLPKDMVEQVNGHTHTHTHSHTHTHTHTPLAYRDLVTSPPLFSLPSPPTQLLKYVPTEGEIESLEGNAHEVDRFAVADRFFYEMSRCVCLSILPSLHCVCPTEMRNHWDHGDELHGWSCGRGVGMDMGLFLTADRCVLQTKVA